MIDHEKTVNQGPTLLVHDCDVLRVENGRAWLDTAQDIVIQGNRISAIRPVSQDDAAKAGENITIQAHGLLAIPGLINTHAHVPMALFRGLVEDVSVASWFNDYIWPLESNLTAEDVYWGALLGLAEMIEGGVTQVADHYFFMDAVAEAVGHSGMRANLAWAVFAHEGPAKLDATCEFVQRWQGKSDGRITAWLGPHAPYTTGPEFLKLCADRAKQLAIGIHTHVSETAEQVQLSLDQYGITPLHMLAGAGVFETPAILAHCLFPTDEDLKLLAEIPAAIRPGIAHAPKTYLKLGMGTAPVRKFRQAGIPIGLATDGAVSSNTFDILEQMRLMALTQKDAAHDSTAMPVAEVLEIAFQGSARVMQLQDDSGSLAPGKLADIVLLRQDGLQVFPRFDPAANLVYGSRASDVHSVICNGKVLLLDSKLLTIDKEQVKREVTARLDRLSQRVPGKRIAFYPA